MELLKSRIIEEGSSKGGGNIVKVSSFLNHQLDIKLLNEIGKEFARRFKYDGKIDKILTVEASGIAIASIASQYFGNVPVVFAKKYNSSNISDDVYEAKVYSYTKEKEYSVRVDKSLLNKGERVIIMDDFLARGGATMGLKNIIEQAEAELVGVGIVIEKSYQTGRAALEERNVKVESLARIEAIEDGVIKFK